MAALLDHHFLSCVILLFTLFQMHGLFHTFSEFKASCVFYQHLSTHKSFQFVACYFYILQNLVV